MTPTPPLLSTAVVLRLQETIGNRAVCRLLNPALSEPESAPAAELVALLPEAVPVPALAQRLAATWRWLSRRSGECPR